MKELNNYIVLTQMIIYCGNTIMNSPFLIKLKKILVIYYVIYMEDKYEGLSDEEIFEDMEADYWIDYYQSLCE